METLMIVTNPRRSFVCGTYHRTVLAELMTLLDDVNDTKLFERGKEYWIKKGVAPCPSD
jgi:hypothetical protein